MKKKKNSININDEFTNIVSQIDYESDNFISLKQH